jgi:hypothetical protein
VLRWRAMPSDFCTGWPGAHREAGSAWQARIMRLHRIALNNYRGVRHAEVSPALSGVTIVQGPNEIGKSSLAEALELVFDVPDSSANARIKAITPVDVDAGPEVEVELTTGPYHVIYTKRWRPGASTRLRLLAPTPESLAGRSAHDRMKEILGETLDEGLWQALRHQQGVSITQASLGDCRTLASTLDAAAAGGAVTGEEEADLWQRVQAERQLYFTATGKPARERVQLAARVSELGAHELELEVELAGIEELSARHRELGVELTANGEQQVHRGELLKDQQAVWDDLQEIRVEVESRRREVELTAASLAEVEARLQERERLIESVTAIAAELESLLLGAKLTAPGLAAAEATQARALAARDEVAAARLLVEATRRRVEADYDHLRDAADQRRLVEALERARVNEASQGQALTFLEGCAIDADRLAEIEQASQAALEARARAAGQAATLHVEALADLELGAGSERHLLSGGESREVAAIEDLQLRVGELALITVSGAAAGRELEAQARLADERLAQLLSDAGVSGGDPVSQARQLERRRAEAEAEVARATEALKADLGDLTVALMAEKVERAQLQLASYLEDRGTDSPMPGSLEEAKATSERAAALAAADQSEVLAQRQLDVAELELGQIREAASQHAVRVQIAEGKAADRQGAIEEARQRVPDAELRGLAVRREIEAAQAQEAHAQAIGSLSGQDPVSAEAGLANTLAVLERLRAEEHDLDLELAQIAGALKVRGEGGLHDQLAVVRSELLQRERESALIERRAAAAELLHDCLARHRDAAQRAYVAPFKAQLDTLARIVFGATVAIEVNHDDLEIASRTLEGVTVPYESLSAGAREQLCVLARLACAALVSPATGNGQPGGVPVIFDDALGYSDTKRLDAVGAAFNVVGEQAQVIVLTCVPERYRNIGSAKVIRLPSTVEGDLSGVEGQGYVGAPQAGGVQPQTALRDHA